MKKIKLSICAAFLAASSQAQVKKDSLYEDRPLKLEEVNFISGYYSQTGNHSAIMGGNGSEKLTEFANSLDLKLIKQSGKFEHTFSFGLAAEHRTSASTAYIDKAPTGSTTAINTLQGTVVNNTTVAPVLSTTSRASRGVTTTGNNYTESSASTLYGWRFNPNANWSVKNLENNSTFGLGAYYSYEFDYQSWGGEVSFAKASMDNNREFSVKGQAFFDQRQMILPYELRGSNYNADTWKSKNSFSLNTSFSQVINQRLQMSVLADLAYQKGILATPYNRVYFNNNTVFNEKLPDSRVKVPLGVRLNYFAGNNVIFRLYYRYYWDNWGMQANTASIEMPVKLSPNFSLSPFYRFSTQTGTKYFNDYKTADPTAQFFTSDYDLSKFSSNNVGVNLHFVPADWGIFKAVDVRYSYYKRSDNLSANNLTLALKF